MDLYTTILSIVYITLGQFKDVPPSGSHRRPVYHSLSAIMILRPRAWCQHRMTGERICLAQALHDNRSTVPPTLTRDGGRMPKATYRIRSATGPGYCIIEEVDLFSRSRETHTLGGDGWNDERSRSRLAGGAP